MQRALGVGGGQLCVVPRDARGAARPVLPVVDTIATLPLDAAAAQRGYGA
jgi:hypothetical protein